MVEIHCCAVLLPAAALHDTHQRRPRMVSVALHSSAHARRCRFHIHYSYIQHAPSDRINTIVRTNKIWIVQHVEDCLATPTVHSRRLNTPTNHTQALPRTNTCYVNTACTHDSFHINEQTTICTIKRVKKTLTIAVRTLNHQRQ
mgnify:CR=1 FL=1